MKRDPRCAVFGLMVLGLGLGGPACATTLTASLSMDNGYQIYVSASDSTAGSSFGAANDWMVTYTHNVQLTAGQDYYLHVFGYDQGGIAGFLGQFSLSGTDHVFVNQTTVLLTNTSDWHGNTSGWGAPDVALSDSGSNGVTPWNTRPGIAAAARWIWPGNADLNDVAYFSTKITAVPEAGSWLLLGAAGFGLSCRRRMARLR